MRVIYCNGIKFPIEGIPAWDSNSMVAYAKQHAPIGWNEVLPAVKYFEKHLHPELAADATAYLRAEVRITNRPLWEIWEILHSWALQLDSNYRSPKGKERRMNNQKTENEAFSLQIQMAELVDATIPDLKFYSCTLHNDTEVEKETGQPAFYTHATYTFKSLHSYIPGDVLLVHTVDGFKVATVLEAEVPQPVDYSNNRIYNWVIAPLGDSLSTLNQLQSYEEELKLDIKNQQRASARKQIIQNVLGSGFKPKAFLQDANTDEAVEVKGE